MNGGHSWNNRCAIKRKMAIDLTGNRGEYNSFSSVAESEMEDKKTRYAILYRTEGGIVDYPSEGYLE